jgi:hypothetical protein
MWLKGCGLYTHHNFIPMTDRPILFSGPMILAIRAGVKTQTRRVVKTQSAPRGIVPKLLKILEIAGIRQYDKSGYLPLWIGSHPDFKQGEKWFSCPYGKDGRLGEPDRLWVRENFQRNGLADDYLYKADMSHVGGKWKPSIHMPRVASRILLEITEVRAERLQDISEEDAIAEGIGSHPEPIQVYRRLWNSINGKTYPWESNPYVWVVSFKEIKNDRLKSV